MSQLKACCSLVRAWTRLLVCVSLSKAHKVSVDASLGSCWPRTHIVASVKNARPATTRQECRYASAHTSGTALVPAALAIRASRQGLAAEAAPRLSSRNKQQTSYTVRTMEHGRSSGPSNGSLFHSGSAVSAYRTFRSLFIVFSSAFLVRLSAVQSYLQSRRFSLGMEWTSVMSTRRLSLSLPCLSVLDWLRCVSCLVSGVSRLRPT